MTIPGVASLSSLEILVNDQCQACERLCVFVFSFDIWRKVDEKQFLKTCFLFSFYFARNKTRIKIVSMTPSSKTSINRWYSSTVSS